MQQENAKKGKKLGWLIAGLAVLLVIVGVVLAVILMPGEQASKEPTGPVGGRPQLYWNVDRQEYLGDDNSAGLSKREPGEDGLYHLLFAVDGKQVEYTIADKRLVNVIDTYDVIGLVFDDAGNVIDAVDPTTIATEVAKGFFIMRSQETRLEMNSSYLMNGMAQTLKLTDLAEIYNVSSSAETVGMVDTLQVMDKVLIYANDKEEVTHIYIVERQPEAEVYWRADRMYDAAAAATSRTPDENGVYTILFAYKGKQVELKCKDKDLVSKIDKSMIYAAPFGLLFDEEGYIIGTVDPAIALRGKLLCSGFNITAIDGDTYTATYLMSGAQNGEEVTFTLGENTEIYNCCIGGSNEFIGEATQLQTMDRVMVYSDMDGNPLIVFVMYRMVDSPIYYNIERKYNDTTKETTRVPDENGYYVFQMAVNGKQVTLKTRNKDIASKVDSFAYNMMGLKVNGNIIEKVYTPYVVCGSDAISPGTLRFVVGQTGVILSFAAQGTDLEATTNMVMTPSTEVVDVSGYPGTKIGEKTTVREGDKIRVLQDIYGNLTHIYITERYTGYPIYYNFSRYYSATAGTTRTPDAEGYYVYEMASKGKQVTVKTKDKTLADYIDKQNPTIVALKVNKSGIITAAAPAESSIKYGRRAAANGLYLNTSDGVMNFTLASTGKTYSTPIASNPAVYNCSSMIFDNFRGEKSKLQKDDQMIAIRDDKLQQVVEVYIIQRKLDCELYYNGNPMYNSVKQETTRVPDAEGWYIFDLAVNGKVKQFKTKDKEVANYIDSRGSGASPFAATVNGNVIKQAYPVTAKRGLSAFAVSNYDFMDAGNGKCVLKCFVSSNAGKTLEAKLAPNYKAYDVSAYAENFGAQVKLRVGDRVICYYNDNYEIEWFYIWYRNVREDGAWSKCSHCNEVVYWMPYSATDYTQDAHLYLTHDQANNPSVIGKANAEVKDQPKVVLDLNGHTLKTAVSADRLFVVYGELSVMDTVGGGKIVARSRNTEKASGCGAIMVQQPGTFKLYSGTLAGSGAETNISNGGIVFVGVGSTFTMYGGTITGGKANNGGNVFNQYGTFNMYGGTITGGTANVGGNVYLGSGTFLMGAGTIDGDVVTTDAAGKVTIVGKSVIGKGKVTGLQLVSGMKLPLSDKVTADTKVTIEAAGVFTTKVTNPSVYLQSFTPVDSTFPVFEKDGTLACGRLAECEACGEEVYWSRFSTVSCTGEAHLVLTGDVELDDYVLIQKNSNVVVDLNGHILSTKGDRTFAVEGGTLSIQDSAGGGKVVGRTNDKEAAAGAIMVYSSGALKLYSGEICGNDAETKITNGGVLFVGASCTFDMYGGTVTGTRATNGGAIHASPGSVITIHDGTITGGEATSYGGNIYSDGTVIIHKGTISGGKAVSGGNICGTSAVRVNAATITGGTATNGGNIYMASGNVRIVGGTIADGVATDGGNIYSATGKIILDSGTVENGAATGKGGNIYAGNTEVTIGLASDTATATVSGGTANQGGNIFSDKQQGNANKAVSVLKTGLVTGGEAQQGGNIHNANTLSISGTVSNGKATDGGNIYAKMWTDIIGTVTGGEAESRGGNVLLDGSTVQLHAGAKVTDGTADKGGNILTTGNVTVLADAEVSGGTATTQAGNIFMVAGSKTLTINGKVLGGTAPTAQNISTVNNVAINVDGGTVTGGSFKLGNGTFTVSGAAVIDNLILNGTPKLTLGALTDGASITLDATGVFTEINENADQYVDYFHPITGAPDVKAHVVDDALILGILHDCAKCETEVMWSAFTGATGSGKAHLVLTGDVELESTALVGSGSDVVVDLNGHTLSTKADRTFNVGGGTLSIQDSAGGGKIVGRTNNSEAAAGTILVYSSGTLNLYSGTLAGSGTETNISKGGIVSVGAGSTFTMYGGTITGGSATNGGNIYSEGTVKVVGGEITGGEATLGGNIYSASAVRVEGGKISGGKAVNGGNIYKKAGVVNLVGGTVENGVATPEVTMNDTVATVTEETGLGGNIYAHQAKVLVGAETGDVIATVTGGKAYRGGNIYSAKPDANNYELKVNAKGVVTLGKAEAVEGDAAASKNYGGNIYNANTMYIYGAVTNGEADDGGNIYAMSWTGIYDGSTISGGKTVRRGGNIFSNSTLEIYGGVIENGEALNGGNIAALANVKVHAVATVQNGTAATGGKGGNIYMIITGSERRTLTVEGKVLGGTAPHGAGIAATAMTNIVVNGGEITGALQPNDANVQITVSGAAKISNLILPEGCKITLGELTNDALITVSATGVFTNESDDAATYQAYFEPAANITLVGKTLSMG